MPKPFDRLQSVLKLEAQQGYKNKAVVGGIRQFASFWIEQAREQALDEADSAFIEQTAQALTDYAQTPSNGRKMLVDRLIERLDERKSKLVATQPPAAIVQKTPSPKPQPKKPSKPVKERPADDRIHQSSSETSVGQPNTEQSSASNKEIKNKIINQDRKIGGINF